MNRIVIHSHTERDLQEFAHSNAQTLLLVGPDGIGMQDILDYIQTLLPADWLKYDCAASDFGIAEIRQIQRQAKLRARSQPSVFLLKNADALSREAQNALLKSIEEPTAATRFVLSISQAEALLTTIRSRCRVIMIKKPLKRQLTAHFEAAGHSQSDIEKAFIMTGGLQERMEMLMNNPDSKISEKYAISKTLLAAAPFERLIKGEQFLKQKNSLDDLLDALQHTCQAALEHAAAKGQLSYQQWAKRCQLVLDAQTMATQNANPKLLLDHVLLGL